MDRVVAFLAPLFLQDTSGDLDAARYAAEETLAGYKARTDQELRLAALIIAFSLRALDALGRAAQPGLDLKIVLRLHGSANALHRAAMQCEKTLDRLRAGEPTAEPAPEPLPQSTAPEDLRTFIRAMRHSGPADIPMSRQQRREAQRRADKIRQRERDATLRVQREAAHNQPALA